MMHKDLAIGILRSRCNYDILCVVSTILFDKKCQSEHETFVRVWQYLVHRVTISIKLRPVKLEQAVSESLPHKGLYTELLGVKLTCLDPVPASIRARNAQKINITNCDVTTWSWVNLVHPLIDQGNSRREF